MTKLYDKGLLKTTEVCSNSLSHIYQELTKVIHFKLTVWLTVRIVITFYNSMTALYSKVLPSRDFC